MACDTRLHTLFNYLAGLIHKNGKCESSHFDSWDRLPWKSDRAVGFSSELVSVLYRPTRIG